MGGKTKTEKPATKKSTADVSQKNDTIQKGGNAYGRQKGTMTGREFGKNRSTASKSKRMKKK